METIKSENKSELLEICDIDSSNEIIRYDKNQNDNKKTKKSTILEICDIDRQNEIVVYDSKSKVKKNTK
jgi:hypothetical protein